MQKLRHREVKQLTQSTQVTDGPQFIYRQSDTRVHSSFNHCAACLPSDTLLDWNDWSKTMILTLWRRTRTSLVVVTIPKIPQRLSDHPLLKKTTHHILKAGDAIVTRTEGQCFLSASWLASWWLEGKMPGSQMWPRPRRQRAVFLRKKSSRWRDKVWSFQELGSPKYVFLGRTLSLRSGKLDTWVS